jgi:hypothetical protein
MEFVLPILYVPFSDLSENNPDEAIRLIARTQYLDWTALRLLGPQSPEYMRAVHGAAKRLSEIGERLDLVQVKNEVPPTSIEDEPDLVQLVNRATELLPSWTEAVVRNQTTQKQIVATFEAYEERRLRLANGRAGGSAEAAELIRLSGALLPLHQIALEDSQTYSSQSIELDPIITAIIRFVTDYPPGMALIGPSIESINEAIYVIRHDGDMWPKQFFLRNSRLTKTFKTLAELLTRNHNLAVEGNQIVISWNLQLSELLARAECV